MTGLTTLPSSVPVAETLFVTRSVKSRLGYDVDVFDEYGDFKAVIILPDDTTQFVYLQTAGFNEMADDLKDILKSYVTYIVQRYHGATLLQKFWLLQRWTDAIATGLRAERVLSDMCADPLMPSYAISTVKELVRFLILHEYEAISEAYYDDILQLHGYSHHPNAYGALFLMDEDHGPFTREEVAVLTAEVDNPRHSLALRLLLALCLNHGLRPIQLSLLKRKDYVTDRKTGLRYLNVPRVKNATRNRRTQFSVRILNDQTAGLIEQIIASTKDVRGVPTPELPIFMASLPLRLERASNVRGCGHWREQDRRSMEYFDTQAKQAYAYHRKVSLLRNMLSYAQTNFPLSPRTGRPFNLHPYRFRYTVGTQAVMSGCTAEEVADLLDHSNSLCVKHYFRFTQEMWEILEQATQRRLEQRHFTAAWLREEDLKNNPYARIVYEPRSFTAIGQCATQTACFDEPAVACYACKRFCPNKDPAAHRTALGHLQQRKEQLLSVASETVVGVFDLSIAGCQAAVAYAEKWPITLIHPSSE